MGAAIDQRAQSVFAAEKSDGRVAERDFAHGSGLQVARQGDHVPSVSYCFGKCHQASSSPFHSIS